MNEAAPELTRQILHRGCTRRSSSTRPSWSNWGGRAGRPPGTPTARRSGPQPQARAWCVVGAVDRALYELLNLDVYDLLGLDVDVYDTAPCPLAVLCALRRPLQRVLGRRDLAHWNDHACPDPATAEQLLREAAAQIGPCPGPLGITPSQ